MTTQDVSRRLARGVDRVRQMDEVLQPVRMPNGHRRYDPRIVERVAKALEKAR